EAVRRLVARRDPDEDAVDVARVVVVLARARLTAVLDLDPERDLLVPELADARPAGDVGRGLRRGRADYAITAEPAGLGVPVAPATGADEAVVVARVQAAGAAMPYVRPLALDVVELVEAAVAAAGRADLTAERRLAGGAEDVRIGAAVGRHAAGGDAAADR